MREKFSRFQIFKDFTRYWKHVGVLITEKLCLMKSWKNVENTIVSVFTRPAPNFRSHRCLQANFAKRARREAIKSTQSKCFHMEMSFNCINSHFLCRISAALARENEENKKKMASFIEHLVEASLMRSNFSSFEHLFSPSIFKNFCSLKLLFVINWIKSFSIVDLAWNISKRGSAISLYD